jgi:hypothetical protein
MILCYILRNKKRDSIYHEEYAGILGVSRPTVIEILSEMERKNLITISQGKYYITENGETRRTANSYKVSADRRSNEKPINKRTSQESNTDISKIEDKGTKHSENRPHKWYVDKSLLTEDDMYVYLTTNDPKLKGICRQKDSGN